MDTGSEPTSGKGIRSTPRDQFILILDTRWCILPLPNQHDQKNPGDRLVMDEVAKRLEQLGVQMMVQRAGVKSVAWEFPKRERA